MWPIFDMKSAAAEVTKPRYGKFFQYLDSLNIGSPSEFTDDWLDRMGQVKNFSQNPIGRSFGAEIIKESFVSVWKKSNEENLNVYPEVRVVASAANPDAVNTAILLSDNPVVVHDTELETYIRDIMYAPRAFLPPEYFQDMVRYRYYLENRNTLFIPKKVWQQNNDSLEKENNLIFDFSSPLLAEESLFFTEGNKNHVEQRVSGKQVTLPILKVGLPILKNCTPELMHKIMSDEEDAVRRFRYISKKFTEESNSENVSEQKLIELFQYIDYEASRIDLQFSNLIRKRQQSLGSVLLGTMGLWLCATLPEEFAQAAKAILGTTSAAGGLKYVYSVADTEQTLRSNDNFIAWKLWKESKKNKKKEKT